MAAGFIRDFIYLDIERVRSFSSQLFKGLPSERTTGGEHETGGAGTVSGKVPFFLEASGAINHRYLKSQSETTSLHDHLFAEFFDRLVNENKIHDLSEMKVSDWEESVFRDGAFLYLHGPVKFVDYKANVALLDSLPDMESLILKMTSLSSSAGQAGGQSPAGSRQGSYKSGTNMPSRGNTQQQQQLQGMRPQIKAMSTLVTQLYGDLIRVKMFPFRSSPDKVLVGSADRNALRYTSGSLTTMYGSTIDAEWTCVVQVNKGTTIEAGALASSSGDQIQDAFEQLVDLLAGVGSLTQGITFPAVAVTPIAICREIH
jgi:hypothetical protein